MGFDGDEGIELVGFFELTAAGRVGLAARVFAAAVGAVVRPTGLAGDFDAAAGLVGEALPRAAGLGVGAFPRVLLLVVAGFDVTAGVLGFTTGEAEVEGTAFAAEVTAGMAAAVGGLDAAANLEVDHAVDRQPHCSEQVHVTACKRPVVHDEATFALRCHQVKDVLLSGSA